MPRIAVTFSLQEVEEIERDCAVYRGRMERIAKHSAISREEQVRRLLFHFCLWSRLKDTSHEASDSYGNLVIIEAVGCLLCVLLLWWLRLWVMTVVLRLLSDPAYRGGAPGADRSGQSVCGQDPGEHPR